MSLTQDVDRLLAEPKNRRQAVAEGLEPFRAEVDEYIESMKGLRYQHPDDAMAWLSSVSARILQMIVTTLDYDGRVSTKFRVETLIPIRDELRFQFQIASRRQAVADFDLKLSGGQAT